MRTAIIIMCGWVGVSKAGYAFSEELPIFLLICLLPAAVAAVIRWKWR